MTTKSLFTLILAAFFISFPTFAQVKGLIQVRAVASDDTQSFQDGGTGLYRHGDNSNNLLLSQGIIDFKADLSSAWSAHAVLNANQEPKTTLGLTQAYLQYQPLVNSRYKWHVKVGGFYPSMSLENPDIGWTSPYNYTNSAINSWIGEELRTVGSELTIKRPGKRFNSKHSFSVSAALYKGNDPTGTLLSWRGFALHDRQTTFNESVQFALIAALNEYELRWQANQVLPFEEVDGRFGYYAGVHWDYLKKSQFRIYYYNNNADPTVFNVATGQYAWHTRFGSAAWLYKLTGNTRFIAQALSGKTEMGANKLIYNSFYSHYLMLSHKEGKYRLSLRYDYFKVDDDDTTAFDPNASNGEGATATWRYQYSNQLQIGVEGSALKSFVKNRAAIGVKKRISQQQIMLNMQWKF
ncbi:hypothetical protein PESP_a3642 [Pseudoalteromonas espejiana DSM 9414]|uniref:Porin n=1 Tax=Pseudoalteromonas espejiana TaxID=28107 RepID=A0A510XVW2_9GAMM|nr:hypothetical protein [Pseudoalteromonas espejiana]ASM51422.1 hypothetical protein PESP_a3642 [Pseudoalteromonas espejiana DSM 9414]GEK55170.1 hypothetical protein PES01_20150 [Pseudoalteromonas espejiana]